MSRPSPSASRGFGTTIRAYDRSIDAWRVHWFAPRWSSFCTLIGRPAATGIHQDGRPIRWSFSDITSTSFTWQSHISDNSGTTWRLEQEMHAHRR